jgi:hypothetical protein
VTEVVELREEVTWVWVTAVMAGTHATRAEKMAKKRVVLLATTRGKEAQRVSALEGKLVAMRQA